MSYTHIVFDVDGTLINSVYCGLRSLQNTILMLTGETMPLEELTFSLGIPGTDTMRQLGIRDIPSALELWNQNMRQYEDTITVFDGVAELLEHLSEAGVELGIVTSETRDEYGHDFCRFDIARRFTTTICAEDADAHKPEPAPLLKYLELTGAVREQVLYVGDSVHDSKCAERARIDFALAGWGSHSGAIAAKYCLGKPTDLLSIALSEGNILR